MVRTHNVAVTDLGSRAGKLLFSPGQMMEPFLATELVKRNESNSRVFYVMVSVCKEHLGLMVIAVPPHVN